MQSVSRARFHTAVTPGARFPETRRREIVFCGRSNVGKSSLLNAVTGVKGLARTSKAPGRTREIHFYEEGEDRFLVDLPGYGYAKISRVAQEAWRGLVEAYLERRSRIALAVVLVDSRHPPFETDLALAEALHVRGIPFLITLTKSDKLGNEARAAALRAARRAFPFAWECVVTSARTGAGLREIARIFDRAISDRFPAGGGPAGQTPAEEPTSR